MPSRNIPFRNRGQKKRVMDLPNEIGVQKTLLVFLNENERQLFRHVGLLFQQEVPVVHAIVHRQSNLFFEPTAPTMVQSWSELAFYRGWSSFEIVVEFLVGVKRNHPHEYRPLVYCVQTCPY